MAKVISINLTDLIISLTTGSDFIKPENFTTLVKILEEKQPDDFSYDNQQRTHTFEYTMDDFVKAQHYFYDKNTLTWIVMKCRENGINAKKLVELLVKARIIDCSNGNSINKGSQAFYNEMSVATDDEIHWYIELGLEPSPYSYREYGCRKDRTFIQKMVMFIMLYNMSIIIESNGISDCYSFSDDIDEVKKFIDWFITKCPSTTIDFNNSFMHFGTNLFTYLYGKGVYPIDLNFIISCKRRSVCEKMDAVQWILTNFSLVNVSTSVLSDALKYQNMDFIKLLLNNGSDPKLFILENLLMKQKRDYDESTDFSYEFVTTCVDYILNKYDIEIPHTGQGWYDFHHRKSYNFDGKSYDWMVSMQKKMQDSIAKRKKHVEAVESANKIFVQQIGMSKEQLSKIQKPTKKNGQCRYYARNNNHADCNKWPHCKYYHGPKEDCYKINMCRNGDKCSFSPERCFNHHILTDKYIKEYNELCNIFGIQSTKKDIELAHESELASRLNKMPWLHYIPNKSLNSNKRIADRYCNHFYVKPAFCHGKVQTDEGPTTCMNCSNIRFMALNKGQVWGRYYCSLEHLKQIEGPDCIWYLQEPQIR